MTNLNARILDAAVKAIRDDLANAVRDSAREIAERTVAEAFANAEVAEAVNQKIGDMDLTAPVHGLIATAVQEAVEREAVVARDLVVEKMQNRTNMTPQNLAEQLVSTYSYELRRDAAEAAAARMFFGGSAEAESRIENIMFRIAASMEGTLTNMDHPFWDRLVARVSANVVARMERSMTAAEVPEGPAEPIRDDAEVLLGAIMNGGPF